ncbi:MAG TPA: hypothetical protein DDZ84_12555 [Firmicutes bacterium]|jgi:ATP-dependent DNA helicase RecG|nr:hypothetical protein [Bacillota bacterium]
MECYHGQKAQPVIEISNNAFKIALPNTDVRREVSVEFEGLSDAERRVMEYLVGPDVASRREIQAAIGLSQSTTIRVLSALAEFQIKPAAGSGSDFPLGARRSSRNDVEYSL